MGLRIKTNVGSLIAQRQLSKSTSNMKDSIEKLSSGHRINKSADDAAGLAVSESMKAKIKSLNVARRNASDGISYLQVAEGGLGEVNNMIVRMRELTTQAASDTIGEKERDFLNREFKELSSEIQRVTNETEFNGSRVLKADGTETDIAIQVGAGGTSKGGGTESGVITINLEQVEQLNTALQDIQDLSITGTSGQELGSGSTTDVFNTLDEAMNTVTDFRATVGALQSRMSSAITSIEIGVENMEAAQSRIRDVDYASETAKLTQSRILSAAGTSVLSQANSLPESVLQLLRR